MTFGRDIIYDGTTIRVIFQPGKTEALFVTFNELGSTISGDRFWGDALFEELNVSAIGFMTATPNWYPSQEMASAISSVKAIIAGKRVITYGHSQGGYGALKYSRKLDAQAVISFCPQWSINPADTIGNDGRFARFHEPEWQNGLQITSDDLSGDRYIIFDEQHKFDKWNAKKILELGGSKSVICPFTGHESVRLIAEGGRSRKLISTFIDYRPDYASEVRHLLREARRKSGTYKRGIVDYLIRKGKTSSLERWIIECRDDSIGIYARINLAVLRNDVDFLKDVLMSTSHAVLIKCNLIALWTIFHKRNMIEQELYIAKIFPKSFANDPWKRLHTVNSLMRANQNIEAEIELRQIVTQFGTKIGADHIKNFAKKLGITEINDNL